MTNKRKKYLDLTRMLVAGCILVSVVTMRTVWTATYVRWVSLGLSAFAYVIVGYDVLFKAVRRMARGSFLDENFLMCIASIGAFVIGDYPEGVAVMLFYKVGEAFEKSAVNKSRKSIKALLSINPDTARIAVEDGWEVINCDEVPVGTLLQVRPGERIPIDGVVTEGTSELDKSALTGESVPVAVAVGDSVMSGSVVLNGVLLIRTTQPYSHSTASRMIQLVEEARSQKAPVENFITAFSKYYTPIVVGLALLVGLVPPLFLGIASWSVWAEWLKRALVFLVVSCPCALVISVPLTYFGAIGAASRLGILLKGGHVFRALARMDLLALDKTGTLTNGRFSVEKALPASAHDTIMQYAVTLEQFSNHPLAQCVCNYAKENGIVPLEGYAIQEIAGEGIIGTSSHVVYVGNKKLMHRAGVSTQAEADGTLLHVAVGSVYLGALVLRDTLKETSKAAVSELHKMGIHTMMLTGDAKAVAARIAEEAGVNTYRSQLLPEEKVDAVKAEQQGHTVGFVGDGINDAPVIVTADVGIAMGGIGSESAIEAADVVIMNDRIDEVCRSVHIARKTQRIVKENIILALFIKVIVMGLGFTPISSSPLLMWLAVGADVGVSVLAILNALRATKTTHKRHIGTRLINISES